MEEVLRLAVEARLADVHVALPGRVESYDASTQVADVKPMVRRPVPSADTEDGFVLEDLPVIPSVPVVHPGGTSWAVHVPLEAGDTVLLVFNERDPTEWRRTGEVAEPADKRLHSLAHAVAIPGYRRADRSIPGASGSNVTVVHKDGFQVTFTPDRLEVGGNSDAAALASKTDDQLNSLKTALNGWTPVSNDGGAALKTALTNWIADLAATASAKLKVGG